MQQWNAKNEGWLVTHRSNPHFGGRQALAGFTHLKVKLLVMRDHELQRIIFKFDVGRRYHTRPRPQPASKPKVVLLLQLFLLKLKQKMHRLFISVQVLLMVECLTGWLCAPHPLGSVYVRAPSPSPSFCVRSISGPYENQLSLKHSRALNFKAFGGVVNSVWHVERWTMSREWCARRS